jgi:hypothetical protein
MTQRTLDGLSRDLRDQHVARVADVGAATGYLVFARATP